jgi:hypothetical protein
MTATEFLLVESQGAWSGPMAERFLDDGAALARAGERVSVLLVQDGVTAALPGAGSGVDRLAAAGATVWVDDFSLAQRALPADRVRPGAAVVDMDTVAGKLLGDGVRVVWH